MFGRVAGNQLQYGKKMQISKIGSKPTQTWLAHTYHNVKANISSYFPYAALDEMLESSKVSYGSFPNEKINDVNGDLVAQSKRQKPDQAK